ncbi:hypothetical protein C2S53_013024 [Perilla frutescens var. hirtella]|uniref:Agglutinin domain-containing protein n=1 Tax=Perilla frutescens var. hirtella TaxID=608512 RepID=A0AAD4P5B2_PERFH|nr:hypothetical protein C2S53_013024 [Perilla frutescens var. hirtella]
MAAEELPQFVVLQSEYKNERYSAYYYDGGVVRLGNKSVFDPLTQIEIERPKDERLDKDEYVHLRFCRTNKYWSVYTQKIYATSNQPEEDTSKPSCTLFQPKIINEKLYFIHAYVQNKTAVQTRGGTGSSSLLLHQGRATAVQTVHGSGSIELDNGYSLSLEKLGFTWVNCDDLVKLPKFVAFKGDNGKYLKSVTVEGYPYLQFSSDDPNLKETAHEVVLKSDGHVCIKSVYFGKYWRRSPNWIWGDSSDESGNETLFWPVRLSDGKIALRSAANNNFCSRLTTEGKTDCLNAAVSTTAKEALFEIKELVDERKISNIRLHLDQARVYDEVPFGWSTTERAINENDTEMDIGIKVRHSVATTHSFSKTLGISAGVKASIKASFAKVMEASSEISFSVSGTFTWDDESIDTDEIETHGSIRVPPRSEGVIRCMGTKGKCNIPFSYTQTDRSIIDGHSHVTEHADGIFMARSSYNFTVHADKFQPLSQKPTHELPSLFA